MADRHLTILRDVLLLTALCAAAYVFGLTDHGLTNWQEAQRALVAREMQARADWIVPTVDGRPYLAKPPLIYWSQLAIATLRGTTTGEFELRLTVALAGWLGVLATYLVARRELGDLAARWSALFLATGLLYVRSARIGEIDILIIPFAVAAIGAIAAAWRTHLDRNRTNLPAVALAALASALAMLAKGPPALLVIGLAGYGAIALHHAWSTSWSRRDWITGAAAAVLLASASAWLARDERWDADAVIGLLLMAALAVPLGATLARLAAPARLIAIFRAYAHTHPIAVLGLPILALWGWGKLVESRIGPEAVRAAARTEAADNLRLLVPESPLNNLEAAAYGAGLGSILAIAAAAHLMRRREPITPRLWVLIAWAGGGLIAFSLLGKGVPRYLTPLWPALAMLGGWFFAGALSRVRSPQRLAWWAAAAVIAFALGQGWWYGHERERRFADRCPRAFLAELLAVPGVDRARLAMFEFETPAIDFYAGVPVEALADVEPRPGLVGVGPRTIADLRADMERSGKPWTLLIRATQPADQDPRPALDRLRDAGLAAEPIPLNTRFTIDNRRTEVRAVRVTMPASIPG